ncbi:MAG: hypothetical protein EXQ70_10775 [Solirubrobacterales bacterium]|nr:hypothetical protein [Solirubrobacterales bacterium]
MPLGRWWGSTAGLVELAVLGAVMLAVVAVGLPAFFRDRSDELDSDAIGAARASQGAAERIGAGHGGRFDGADGVTTENLRGLDSGLAGARISVIVLKPRAYRVRVLSDTGTSFDIGRNRNGTVNRTCVPAGEGRCGEEGTWR